MYLMDISGLNIVITGASKGIGAILAQDLARQGANLILIGRDFIGTEKISAALYIEADLTTEEGMIIIDNSTSRASIDVLINMAGIGIYKPLKDLEVSDLEYSLELNTIAPFKLIKLFSDQLKESQLGLVLNIGSGAGTMPFANRSVYCASKYALRGLSLSLAEEQGENKPKICLITLGSTMTTFGGKSIEDQERKVKEGRAIFPPEYVSDELIKIIQADKRDSEIILYPSEHNFGEWSKADK